MTAAEWLAAAAPYPHDVLRTWARRELASVPAGKAWDVVRLLPTHGQAVVLTWPTDRALGPVMVTGDIAWEFLVPPGTAESWSMRRTTAVGPGQVLLCPHPRARHLAVQRRYWQHWPDEPGTLTNPVLLADLAARYATHGRGVLA